MEPVTKERLARYISLKKENENRLERLARMKSNAEMPAQRDPDGSKHTGSSGREWPGHRGLHGVRGADQAAGRGQPPGDGGD